VSDLLAGETARRLALLERWTEDHDAYPYQRALHGRSGAWADVEGRRLLMLSSYDYLGLIGHPAIEAAAHEALRRYGTATGGVRLLTGTTALHRELEAAIAEFVGAPAAITFSSGYLANIAAITTLFGPADEILVDEHAHRSIIDASLLARARVRRFRHNDLAALEQMLARAPSGARRLIVVEGVYSMHGDVPPLAALVEIKRRAGAFLMVDEAHALGVLGATGRGSAEHHGVPAGEVDLWVGALSKAIPSNGGFVAARADVIRHLSHAAAPFIFSSAASPAVAAAALAGLAVVRDEAWRLQRLRDHAASLRDGLRARGGDVGQSTTAIVPLRVGADTAALAASRRLLDHDIHATPIIHPAVARGEARLRLCASAAHSEADLARALAALEPICETARLARDEAA
jgi:glycine C-acetyltransferase